MQVPKLPSMNPAAAAPVRVLRRREAAAYCGLSEGHFSNLATKGEGPPMIALGVRARGYEIRELDAWLASLEAARRERDAARSRRPTTSPEETER